MDRIAVVGNAKRIHRVRGRVVAFMLLLQFGVFALDGRADIVHEDLPVQSILIEAITIQDGKYPLMPGDSARAIAVTYPKEREVEWAVLPESGSMAKAQMSDDGIISAAATSGNGYVIIRATDKLMPELFKEAKLYIGCQTCSSDQCATPGNGLVQLGSVDVRLGLGLTDNGKSAGELFVKADIPSADLATPKSLVLSTFSKRVTTIVGPDDVLRQLISPQSFVDVLPVDQFSYKIKFYTLEAMGDMSDGFYQVKPDAQPISIWTIANPDGSVGKFDRLTVTEVKGGLEKIYAFAYQEDERKWSLVEGEGLRRSSRQEETEPDNGNRVVTKTVVGADSKPASISQTVFHQFSWGEEIVKEIVDPDVYALTSQSEYYEDQTDPGSYGQLYRRINPDGSWVRYEYDRQGRVSRQIRPWLDQPLEVSADEAHIIENDYQPVDRTDSEDPLDERRPRMVTEKIDGQVVSRTYYVFQSTGKDGRTEITEQCLDFATGFGHPGNLRRVTGYYPFGTDRPESGKIKFEQAADGQITSYRYEAGGIVPALAPSDTGFIPGRGSEIRQIVTRGTVKSPKGLADKTTREVSIVNAFAQVLFSETQVYTGSGYEQISWQLNELDSLGRVKKELKSDGSETETSWSCCGKEFDVDVNGRKSSFIYDALNRIESETVPGPVGPIITSYNYDAANRRLGHIRSAGNLSQTLQKKYDLAGRLLSSAEAGLITRYEYEPRSTIVTKPGGATEITSKYQDGQIKSIAGSGVVDRFYSYGVHADGSRWTKIYFAFADSPRWQKTTTDPLGRVVKIESPGYETIEVVEHVYNRKGQLIRTSTGGRADTIYLYDELGNQVASGLDVDQNRQLDLASTDRITGQSLGYVLKDGDWWQEAQQQVYATVNDAVPTITAIQRTRLTGLGEKNLTAEQHMYDVHGNLTVARIYTDRNRQTVTSIIDHPDSVIDAVVTRINGLAASSTSKSGITHTFSYDALGRRIAVIDPRTGKQATHYHGNGQVAWTENAAGNRTTYGYHAETGRKIWERNSAGKYSRYAYNDHGQLTRNWGDVPYPVQYVYDDFGQRSEMHTFRDGSIWSEEAWPAKTGQADRTIWHFHEPSGLLESKEDAKGYAIRYSYLPGNMLHTRTWARQGGNVVTAYEYDPATGEIVTIDYNDDTPDISFSYNRQGRKYSITDALGSRIFFYTDTLQLESESISGFIQTTIYRDYELKGVKGRNTGLHLDDGYEVSYGYDGYGRFETVDWQYGSRSNSATYHYLPDSYLIHELVLNSGTKTIYDYEPHRNLKTAIRNSHNDTLISEYVYQYDILARRKNVSNSGIAFDKAAFTSYAYNNRSELVESERYLGNNVINTSDQIWEENRSYQYDAIGNRDISTLGAENSQASIDYQTNALNQYEAITGGSLNDLQYDEDGNLIGYTKNGKKYLSVYNAENRLIKVAAVDPSLGDTKSEFLYDYMGRRVSKTVSTWNGASWQQAKIKLFIYDGWNLIAERDETKQTQAVYAWGLDLSGSLQGAGGIGGLLARVDVAADKAHLYLYDANGNVGQLVDAEDGVLEAAYEYDPYGNGIRAQGAYAEMNPFRFSTKYCDSEIGLYYYGYRYYVPELGRWLTRDPLSEEGGLNLYALILNNAINGIDLIGLKTTFSVRMVALQIGIGGIIGNATAVSDCVDGKRYVATYNVWGGTIGAGVNLRGIKDILSWFTKNLTGVSKAKTFEIEPDYPPSILSWIDAEGPAVSLGYSAGLIDMEVSPHEGGRGHQRGKNADVKIITHGFNGDIGVQLVSASGISLYQNKIWQEDCCEKRP